MVYTKVTWDATTLRSGRNMVHLETQYSEMKTLIDAHTHDARYYPKALADLTFYSLTYMAEVAMPDADTLDGTHASGLVSNTMPIGAIMWWSGTDGNVPTNWHVCDGTTVGAITTPDLRGKFIIGAGDTYDPGDSGGAESLTPTATLTIATHALTADEMPNHTHSITDYYNIGVNGPGAGGADGTGTTNRTTGNPATYGTAHGHSGSTITISQIDKRPRWKALFLIEKVS